MKSSSILQLLVRQTSAWSSLLVPRIMQPERVVQGLNAAGLRSILAGTHATNAWTGRVRATMEVEIVVDARHHKKAVCAVKLAFPHLQARNHGACTQFLDRDTDQVVIDLIKSESVLLRAVFGRKFFRQIAVAGERLLIPDLEAAAAMKFAAMVSDDRPRADKLQDAADFARLLVANPKIRLGKLEALGEFVYPGGGREILRLVTAIRKGEPLVF